MESNDKLKEIHIKNRACYYFDDIIKTEDSDINNILTNGKTCENILVFLSVMLHFHGWSLSKGVHNNKNGSRHGRFSLRGRPRCFLSKS